MSPNLDTVASLCAYAVEGGLDGRYQPATIFNAPIALARVSGPGDALSLWRDYEVLLEAAASHGVRQLRLELSWARLEPHRAQPDDASLTRYRHVLEAARSLGVQTEIAACDGAWPAWLGMEPLLWPWSRPVLLAHLERVATAFTSADGVIALARPESLTRGYLDASGPPWRRRAHDDARDVAEAYQRVVTRATAEGWIRPAFDPAANERPLVSGVGPLARPDPLFELVSGEWRPTAS